MSGKLYTRVKAIETRYQADAKADADVTAAAARAASAFDKKIRELSDRLSDSRPQMTETEWSARFSEAQKRYARMKAMEPRRPAENEDESAYDKAEAFTDRIIFLARELGIDGPDSPDPGETGE
jgi:hypothetical protein